MTERLAVIRNPPFEAADWNACCSCPFRSFENRSRRDRCCGFNVRFNKRDLALAVERCGAVSLGLVCPSPPLILDAKKQGMPGIGISRVRPHVG